MKEHLSAEILLDVLDRIMDRIDPEDVTWWNSVKGPDRNTEKVKWKRKVYPPEPEGFRKWMAETYPRADQSIRWGYLCDHLPDVIREYTLYCESDLAEPPPID